jgi:GntR family transcriptional regulator / MocR family aminotransferase
MDLHITLTGGRGLSATVYRQIREGILTGKLRGGDPLPSGRALASRIQVSRNTVVEAYARLRAEGFLETRAGSGTFVRHGIHARSGSEPRRSPLRPRASWTGIAEEPDLLATAAEFDFRPGIPDAAAFPFPEWRARLRRQIRPGVVGTGAHIGAAGDSRLRAALARHVSVSRGVRARADDVFVTNGVQQAVDLLMRVLLEPGDVVALEDPGYPPVRRAFEAYGARVAGVPVDEDGLVVEAIPSGCRLVYVTPSHQYPLGMAMSMERRQALLAWADSADGAVLEDDYDCEFRYDGRPLEPLQALDNTGRVIYLGSLSKVLLPTLRLGFAVLPEPLHSAFRKAKHLTDWHSPVPTQGAAAEFIDDGLLARHTRRMRRVYAERHRQIVGILQRDLKGALEPVTAHGGLHVTAFLRNAATSDDVRIAERAAESDIAIIPLSPRYSDVRGRPGLVFGYGAIATPRISKGLERLARLI